MCRCVSMLGVTLVLLMAPVTKVSGAQILPEANAEAWAEEFSRLTKWQPQSTGLDGLEWGSRMLQKLDNEFPVRDFKPYKQEVTYAVCDNDLKEKYKDVWITLKPLSGNAARSLFSDNRGNSGYIEHVQYSEGCFTVTIKQHLGAPEELYTLENDTRSRAFALHAWEEQIVRSKIVMQTKFSQIDSKIKQYRKCDDTIREVIKMGLDPLHKSIADVQKDPKRNIFFAKILKDITEEIQRLCNTWNMRAQLLAPAVPPMAMPKGKGLPKPVHPAPPKRRCGQVGYITEDDSDPESADDGVETEEDSVSSKTDEDSTGPTARDQPGAAHPPKYTECPRRIIATSSAKGKREIAFPDRR